MNSFTTALKILLGCPKTTEAEREFSDYCLKTATERYKLKAARQAALIEIHEGEYALSRQTLKGTSQVFCTTSPDAAVRKSTLRKEIRRMEITLALLDLRLLELQRESSSRCQQLLCDNLDIYSLRVKAAATARAGKGNFPGDPESCAKANAEYAAAVASARKTQQENDSRAYQGHVEELDLVRRESRESHQLLHLMIAELRSEIAGKKLDCQFKRIDMSFLRMVKRKGTDVGRPLFVAFELESSLFAFTVRHSRKRGILMENLEKRAFCWPHAVMPLYAPAFHNYMDKCLEQQVEADVCGLSRNALVDHGMTFGARFTGQLPLGLDRIQEVNPKFDEILLVTEAPEWTPDFRNTNSYPTVSSEPLVIGRKLGAFWLIE